MRKGKLSIYFCSCLVVLVDGDDFGGDDCKERQNTSTNASRRHFSARLRRRVRLVRLCLHLLSLLDLLAQVGRIAHDDPHGSFNGVHQGLDSALAPLSEPGVVQVDELEVHAHANAAVCGEPQRPGHA